MPPVLELNPRHALVKALSEQASSGANATRLEEAAFMLLASAEILDGEAPSDPSAFNRRLLAMMELAFGAGPAGQGGETQADGGSDG